MSLVNLALLFTLSDGSTGVSIAQSDITVGLHEPIVVDLVFSTEGERQDILIHGWKRSIHLTVQREDGEITTYGHYRYIVGGVAFPLRFELVPGDDWHRQLVLNEWFSPEQPGRYQVFVEVEASIDGDDASGFQAPVLLHVGEQNRDRLTEICRSLLARALEGAGEDRTIAVESLAWVGDRMAVPYLAEVLRADASGEAEAEAVRALGRLGGRAVAEVLLAISPTVGVWIQIEVYNALSRVRSGVADEVLARRIDRTLSELRKKIGK